MIVLLPRVPLRAPHLRLALGDVEVFARDDDVGGVGCAGPFLTIQRALSFCFCSCFLCRGCGLERGKEDEEGEGKENWDTEVSTAVCTKGAQG